MFDKFLTEKLYLLQVLLWRSDLQCAANVAILVLRVLVLLFLIFTKTRYEVVAWKKKVKGLWNLKGYGFWVLKEGLQTPNGFAYNTSAVSKSLLFFKWKKIVNFWMKKLFPNLHFKKYQHER